MESHCGRSRYQSVMERALRTGPRAPQSCLRLPGARPSQGQEAAPS